MTNCPARPVANAEFHPPGDEVNDVARRITAELEGARIRAFNFSSCYAHNYREFMGGFADWVETIADSRDGKDYRRRVKDSECVTMNPRRFPRPSSARLQPSRALVSSVAADMSWL